MNAYWSFTLPILLPLILAATCIPIARRLALSIGLVDNPNAGAHKSHDRPIPYGGGIAVLYAILTALLLGMAFPRHPHFPAFLGYYLDALQSQQATLVWLIAGTMLVFALGFIDDWRGLHPLLRFLVQILAAGLLVYFQPVFRPDLFGSTAVAFAFAIFWIVALTNAFNFLDNMDGLSAGIGIIALLVLAGLNLHHPSLAVFCMIIAGSFVGFLFFNFPPASVFMGDAGGFFLGFVAASLSLWGTSLRLADHGSQDSLACLVVLAVPAYDLISVITIRLKNGTPPWIGDHNHISHRLVRQGMSRRTAVLVIYLVTLVSGLVAIGWDNLVIQS
jgi:UDP-GlcNAc:undecaprenyl-phosphate GlcNAc-1-phosphate transferase